MRKGLFSFFFCCLGCLLMWNETGANNIRITRNVVVEPGLIVNNIATIDFALEWDNSWRDDFNWDAAYVFLKCKKKTENEWTHVLLKSEGHVVSADYQWWVNSYTTNVDYGTGIFIYRKANDKGKALVDVKLKWLITRNGLTMADFYNENVEYTAMCIEMVYTPSGPYWLGDGYSKNTFKSNCQWLSPEYDLIKSDGTMKFDASGDKTSAAYNQYPPENAANRINESRNIIDNAWYATTASCWWSVEFDTPKMVRYFGVSGVSGRTSNRPTSWNFEGSVDGRSWTNLRSCSQDEWFIVSTGNSYPVGKVLKIAPDKVKNYKFYRIRTTGGTARPMMNNISMTDVEMDSVVYNAFLLDQQSTIALNTTTGLCAEDGDTWNSNLQVNYPTGYNGFYVMKYEVSQDQYVRFLNKLQLRQQKIRTIGDALENLSEGQYVYGSNRDVPSARNGIIVGARLNNQIVFANDLNKGDAPLQEGDGQTIACNYLSPADMLAYADWTGLRPLSEMEYEKMARRPFPYEALRGEWAWNRNDPGSLKFPQSDIPENEGMRTEGVPNANVNAGNSIPGPVRVGAFAKGATDQAKAGASFWGVMDLSGNLAEIYYSLNTSGRSFMGNSRAAHGDGSILPETNASKPGDANLSASYWPIVPKAFTLRGGSFKSLQNEITISDRTNSSGYFTDWNQKDSTVGFRLGCSYVSQLKQTTASFLTMENGRKGKTNGAGVDSVCIGQTYTITGSLLLSDMSAETSLKTEGKCEYIWYVSNEASRNWQVIPGERGKDLVYNAFYNNGKSVRPLYFKRKTVTPVFESETPYVIVRIINDSYEVNSLKDTVYTNNSALGLWIETTSSADFTWKWRGGGYNAEPLKTAVKNKTFDYYYPTRDQFNNISNQTQYVECTLRFLKSCVQKVNFEIFVQNRPQVGILSSQITLGGTDARNECGVLMQDNRDGEIYGTVKIGNQCWMSENLRYSGIGGAYFQTADPAGEKLGALYTWNVSVRDNACPQGWRIPANTDWEQLRNFLNADGYGLAGQKMKAGSFWAVTSANKQYMGTNVSGFAAVGAGYANGIRTSARFFSFNSNVHTIAVGSGAFNGPSSYSGNRASIRCIKR